VLSDSSTFRQSSYQAGSFAGGSFSFSSVATDSNSDSDAGTSRKVTASRAGSSVATGLTTITLQAPTKSRLDWTFPQVSRMLSGL
jgi:hypothetical protein